MAITATDSLIYLPPYPNDVSLGPTHGGVSFRLNSATDWCAIIFQAPKTGTLTDIFWETYTVTTGCTVAIRLETVSTTTGLPTGTLVAAGAITTQVVADTNDSASFQSTLGTAPSVTKGDLLAIVFSVSSGTPSSLQFQYLIDSGIFSMPYLIEYDGTATQINNVAPQIGLKYGDGTYPKVPGFWPIKTTNDTSFNSGSTPDTIGNAFTLSHQTRVCGCWLWADVDANCTVKLYDSDGVTVLASAAIYTNVSPFTNPTIVHFLFDISPTLAAATEYYLAVEATSGSNLTVYDCQFNAAALREASPLGGDRWQKATCTQTPTGTGSWTKTSTRQTFIGLLVDGLEAAVGGGLGAFGPVGNSFIKGLGLA